MSASDSNPDAYEAQATQPDAHIEPDVSSDPVPQPASSTEMLDHARKFLATEEVRNASREKKASFLKSKGLSDDAIEVLLAEQETTPPPSSQMPDEPEPVATKSEQVDEPPPQPAASTATKPTTSTPPLVQAMPNMPPIVTYPEFLTKPERPPPLITVSRLLNTLYAAAGLGAALYGTSKFVINPMVDTLASAREELAHETSENLAKLLTKLESVVSTIPPSPVKKTFDGSISGGDDGASDCSDPTELFHRDIGTQTSSPPSPKLSTSNPSSSNPSQVQGDRLAKLTSSLKAVAEGLVSQGEESTDINATIDALRGDLDKMTFPDPSAGSYTSYGIYGSGAMRNEPDDEIKKARDGIRRLKGVLLSARSFPR